MKVVELKPERDTLIEDLRRYANQLERGELSATTAIIVFQDRINQKLFYKLGGEVLTYSQNMGLLSYLSIHLYEEANKGTK